MNPLKMNTLLAKVDHTQSVFNAQLAHLANYFKTRQGAFRGEKKTYTPREGYPEEPSKMGTTQVQATVKEQLDYFAEIAKKYMTELFSVEATNSAGAKKVELIVGNQSFGEMTALDLMRLKSLLTSKELQAVYDNIPVYSDTEAWSRSDDQDYTGREVLETPLIQGVSRTTETEEVILRDPNIDPHNIPANYRAAVVSKRKTVEIGDYTLQKFSGEWSQRQKAELLARKNELLKAVIAALKEVNDGEVEQPNVDVEAVLKYIHGN